MADDPGVPTSKVGNVTRAPELRFSKAGAACCKFGLAVTPFVPKGQPEAETIFYDVTCFGSLAENVAETIEKGARVLVIGTGKVETWAGKDNQEHKTKVILADACGPDLRFASAVVSRNERPS